MPANFRVRALPADPGLQPKSDLRIHATQCRVCRSYSPGQRRFADAGRSSGRSIRPRQVPNANRPLTTQGIAPLRKEVELEEVIEPSIASAPTTWPAADRRHRTSDRPPATSSRKIGLREPPAGRCIRARCPLSRCRAGKSSSPFSVQTRNRRPPVPAAAAARRGRAPSASMSRRAPAPRRACRRFRAAAEGVR